jgi:hypothetical protein
MSEQQALVNRVEQSGIVTLDLERFYPTETIEEVDLKKYLVKELVLMEKPFREALKSTDWSGFRDKTVAIYCSNDALIPLWAYMLVASHLEPYAKRVLYGDAKSALAELFKTAIAEMDITEYKGARVVIKGCGDKPLPPEAYVAVTTRLQPVVQSIMYGEPCSTVPVYKKPQKPA